MDKFKFILVTDTHFFKNSLGAYGKEYDEYMTDQQKCFAETESINRSVFEWLKTQSESDTVLFAGDLTFNGEKESHEEFSKLLGELKDSGKKVFVVTAGHDCSPDPYCYPGTARQPAQGIKFDDLYDYYHPFGYDEALSLNRKYMSYMAQLSDGIRLLVLCNDTPEKRGGAYSDELLSWAKEQLDKAKEDGQTVIAMQHYPMLPGQPILGLIGDAWQKSSAEVIPLLADNGVHLILTGHMHNQSINSVKTEKGNVLWDVCTGSIVGWPAFMRIVTLDRSGETAEIKSVRTPDFDWNLGGLSSEDYLKRQFDSMIRFFIGAMKNDPEKFMRKVHIKNTPVVKKLIVRFGKILNDWSVRKFARLLLINTDKSLANVKTVDLLADTVRYIFEGNQPYTDATPEGDFLLKVLKRLSPVLKIAQKNLKGPTGEKFDLYTALVNSFGNYDISDYDTILKLK